MHVSFYHYNKATTKLISIIHPVVKTGLEIERFKFKLDTLMDEVSNSNSI